ncbi:hypothetical protein NST33_17630 [Paenibacillus sp. FSL L8-0435]|uniref:hypothetical protein n=1 Tax=Paenibacillus sp. FSL L8-0435 TaxID=2954618 RepID=UPI0030D7CB60
MKQNERASVVKRGNEIEWVRPKSIPQFFENEYLCLFFMEKVEENMDFKRGDTK